jgi:hypothetical protein
VNFLVQMVKIRVLGVVQKGLKRLLGGPLDEDHRLVWLGIRLPLLNPVQPAQGHDPTAVLAHGLGRSARVLPVGIVAGHIEQVEGVQRHPYCAAIFDLAASGPS